MGHVTWAFLALVTLPALIALWIFSSTLRGLLRLPLLAAVPCPPRAAWPTLTIISPACNEERQVASAVASMLSLDYPGLRVIAVNDRSTDATGALLDAAAAKDERLTVKHVTALPEGWLGKLNALNVGVTGCESDWLLFMDADAHLAPAALTRAISHCEEHAVDCLSVIPQIAPCGLVGDAVFDVSLALLSANGRLVKVRDPASRHVAATGAFILVRGEAFRRTPGFSWLKLEVADDFGLALLIKTHGGRCDIINGRGEVTLEWYASFTEMAKAMQKNMFAIVARFSLARAVAVALGAAWMGLFWLGVLAPVAPVLKALPLLGALSMTAATVLAARACGRAMGPALLWPLGFLATGWMTLRAGVIGARIGGIQWRGVVYPSALLAGAQRVRL